MTRERMDDAVTEVLSSIILLSIALGVFAAGSLIINDALYSAAPVRESDAIIVGSIQGDNIVLEHRGGQALTVEMITIAILINDVPVSDDKISIHDKYPASAWDDDEWNIGEQVIANYTQYLGAELSGTPELAKIRVLVVDNQSNTLIFNGVIQTGDEQKTPGVTTQPATNITTNTSEIHMSYHFYRYSGAVRFDYKLKSIGLWSPTPWVYVGDRGGSWNHQLTGLSAFETTYEYRGVIRYTDANGSVVIEIGEILEFTTLP